MRQKKYSHKNQLTLVEKLISFSKCEKDVVKNKFYRVQLTYMYMYMYTNPIKDNDVLLI